MASKSTHSLLDFSENRPLEGIGRSNSSNSLTGESSSAARVKMNGLFVVSNDTLENNVTSLPNMILVVIARSSLCL